MKKYFYAVIFLLPFLAFVTVQAFTDVPDSHIYSEAIEYVKERGIVEGYNDGNYHPDNTINRVEFLKILLEADDTLRACTLMNVVFPDTDPNAWYDKYIQEGVNCQIVKGHEDGTFRPSAPINYAEAAKIVVLTFSLTGDTETTGAWYEPYLLALEHFKAVPRADIEPFDLLTRGEMAQMIYLLQGQEDWDEEVPEESLENYGFMDNVDVEQKGDYLYVSADGVPNHETGAFPNSGNPNTISAQDYDFRIDLTPQYTGEAQYQTGLPSWFGVAINGVPFEPGTAEYWNNDRNSGWNIDAFAPGVNLGLDLNDAHVQPTGAYHYHGTPNSLVDLAPHVGESILLGYAADGFPIYYQKHPVSGEVLKTSWRLKTGSRPNDGPPGNYDGTYIQDYEYIEGYGDLDECNGLLLTGDDYAYFITADYPFIGRCHMGEPDDSFDHGQAGGPPGGPGMRPPPPRRL